MSSQLTAEEAARLYPRLAWFNEQCFHLVGAALPGVHGPAVAALVRHLGEHGQRWRELVPESVLLAHFAGSGPPDGTAADLVAALESADDPVAVLLHDVVPWLRATYDELVPRLAPHAEGAARRLVRIARDDLAAALVSGDA